MYTECSCSYSLQVGTRTWIETVSAKPEPQYAAKFADFGVAVTSPKSKRDYMRWRDQSTTTSTLGFRFTGMAVARSCSGPGPHPPSPRTTPSFVKLGDGEQMLAWTSGVGLSATALPLVLCFLHDGVGFRGDVAGAVVAHLRDLQTRLTASAVFGATEVIGSSLLLVYDRGPAGVDVETGRPFGVCVRWIDFSNTYAPTVGWDDVDVREGRCGAGDVGLTGAAVKKDGVLHGVASLVEVFTAAGAAIASNDASVLAGALAVPCSSIS